MEPVLKHSSFFKFSSGNFLFFTYVDNVTARRVETATPTPIMMSTLSVTKVKRIENKYNRK